MPSRHGYSLFILLLHTVSPINISIGNTDAQRMPFLRSSPNIPDMNPTNHVPQTHPTSPASARIPYMNVPPFGQTLAAMLSVPGQKIPTEKPHSAHPARLRAGNGDREAVRYPIKQRMPLTAMKRTSPVLRLKTE